MHTLFTFYPNGERLFIFYLLCCILKNNFNQVFCLDGESICKQLVTGETDVAVYGLTRGKNVLLLDSKQWKGYMFRVESDFYQREPPFSLTLLPSAEIGASKLFPAFEQVTSQLMDDSKLSNVFLIEGWPKEYGQVASVRFRGNTAKHLLLTFLQDRPIWFEESTIPDNVLVLGVKLDCYTWGLSITGSDGNKSSSIKACLVDIGFTLDLLKVNKFRPRPDRCISISSAVRRGFFCKKTGIITLFHVDQTVSVIDTGGLGLQLLEHKPYSKYFICDNDSNSVSWILIIAGVSLLLLLLIIILERMVRRKWRKKRKRMMSNSSKSDSSTWQSSNSSSRKKMPRKKNKSKLFKSININLSSLDSGESSN